MPITPAISAALAKGQPAVFDLSALMADSLLVALTDQAHQVDGHAASVAGLVRRGYAYTYTSIRTGGETHPARLTRAGIGAAVGVFASLCSDDVARRAARRSASVNALRVLRVGDENRSPRVMSTVGPDGRSVPGGSPVLIGPVRAALKVTELILAGGKAIRNDATGVIVRVVHLCGDVTVLRAAPIPAARVVPPVVAQRAVMLRALSGQRS